MWKKIMMGCIMLLATASLAYAYCSQELNAATSTYRTGGNISGRVNMAPNGISGDHIGLQVGDHVMIGGNNPYTGNPLSFQLLWYDQNYTDYDNTRTTNVERAPLSNWLSASDELVAAGLLINDIKDASIYRIFTGDHDYGFGDYTQTTFYNKEREFNAYLQSNAEQSIIAKRDLSDLRNASNKFTADLSASYSTYASININEINAILEVAKDQPAFFSSSWFYYTGSGENGLNAYPNLLAFSHPYLTTLSIRRGVSSIPDIIHILRDDGTLAGISINKSDNAT